MRQGLSISGADAFSKKLGNFAEQLGRSTRSLLAQEARALAVELGSGTAPLGLQQAGGEQNRKRVDREVRRVFASRQSPAAVFKMLQARAPQLANAYWHAFKAGKTRKMGQILTKAGLPETGTSPATLHAARTTPTAGVPKSQIPQVLVRESEVRALSRRQQLLVGAAKAGWYQAAKSLGGRVRRNLREGSEGIRRTEEIFPDYVRKISNRFSGLGGSYFTEGEIASVTIYSSVRHALDAFPDSHFIDAAIDRAGDRFYKGLAMAVRIQNLNTFKSAA